MGARIGHLSVVALVAFTGASLSWLGAKQKERVLLQGDDPAVSPDGKLLALRRWIDGNSEILLAPMDGSSPPRRLTNHPAADRFPAWSPDGRKICFVSTRSGNMDLWLMQIDHPESPERLTINPGPDDEPTWSPDGDRIAYSATVGGSMDLFVITSMGSEPTRLTQDSYDDMHPAWSPDGLRLAFVSNRGDGNNIWMLDLAPVSEAGRVPIDASASGAPFHIYQLTTGAFDDREPVWHPKGRLIAFSSDRADTMPDERPHVERRRGARSIFAVSTGPRPILSCAVTHAGILEEPAWTPNGRSLLYVDSPLRDPQVRGDEARPVIRLVDR